ncbi:MAG: hypothetical protein ACW964_04730 [Candidatus Hodarchaeales archaeon]
MEIKQIPEFLHKVFSDRKNSLIIISLIFNLIIHLIIALSYYNPVDFILQYEAAKKIAQGMLLYRDIGVIQINGYILPRPQYPPLYLYTLGILIALFGVEIFTWQMAKIFLIIVNIFVSYLIYYLINHYIQPRPNAKLIALGAFNFFSLNPSTLGIILGGFHDNFMILFVLLGLIQFKKGAYSTSGIFFGLSTLVKPIAVLYMLPIIVWGLNSKKQRIIQIWGIAGLTFLLGSLPFLLLAPTEYFNDVFLIHTQRLDISMSFYTYFFPETFTTLFPFLIQFILLCSYIVVLSKKGAINDSYRTIMAILPFITLFMVTNRILYPHYIPFFFPFFTITLFIIVGEYFNRSLAKNEKISALGLIIGLILIYTGTGGFSILWISDRYEAYQTNPLFLISSILYLFGLLLISLVSFIFLISTSKNEKGGIITEGSA